MFACVEVQQRLASARALRYVVRESCAVVQRWPLAADDVHVPGCCSSVTVAMSAQQQHLHPSHAPTPERAKLFGSEWSLIGTAASDRPHIQKGAPDT